MSDPTQPPPVRPMAAADYAQGQPVRQPRRARTSTGPLDHPLRDVAVASVLGAVALWVVPKALDFVANGGLIGRLFGGDADGEEELELEDE